MPRDSCSSGRGAELGEQPRGSPTCRSIFDSARRRGRSHRSPQDRPRPRPRPRLLHGRRLRDDRQRLGTVRQRRLGGRYDNLASLFTDRKLPGVGASIGLDRLLALMEEAGWLKGTASTTPRCSWPTSRALDRRPSVQLAVRAKKRRHRRRGLSRPDPDRQADGIWLDPGPQARRDRGPDEESKQIFNLRDLATRKERQGDPLVRPGRDCQGRTGEG